MTKKPNKQSIITRDEDIPTVSQQHLTPFLRSPQAPKISLPSRRKMKNGSPPETRERERERGWTSNGGDNKNPWQILITCQVAVFWGQRWGVPKKLARRLFMILDAMTGRGRRRTSLIMASLWANRHVVVWKGRKKKISFLKLFLTYLWININVREKKEEGRGKRCGNMGLGGIWGSEMPPKALDGHRNRLLLHWWSIWSLIPVTGAEILFSQFIQCSMLWFRHFYSLDFLILIKLYVFLCIPYFSNCSLVFLIVPLLF